MHIKQTSENDNYMYYMTKKTIIRSNNRAKKMGLNRAMDSRFLKTLHPSLKYPVMAQIFHAGYNGSNFGPGTPDCKRVIVYTQRSEHSTLIIDIPIKFFSKDVFVMKNPNHKEEK
mgnify:CR=1 FL=1|tara:strand:+ start:9634 stop:9978 length:345 start_codon:yes stop_codon:yes gene_type:complete